MFYGQNIICSKFGHGCYCPTGFYGNQVHKKFDMIKFGCQRTCMCKIFMPESQEYIALNPETWPADITCRKWERQTSWNNKWNNRQDSGNDYHKQQYREGFWDNVEDRDNRYDRDGEEW